MRCDELHRPIKLFARLWSVLILLPALTTWPLLAHADTPLSVSTSSIGNIATSTSTECNISFAQTGAGNPCAAGSVGNTSIDPASRGVVAARINDNTNAAIAIDAFGYCYYVNDTSPMNSFFIPFGAWKDWNSYLTIARNPPP